MREHDLYPHICYQAKKSGFFLWRVNDATSAGKAPFDIAGVGPSGIAVAAEVKVVRVLNRGEQYGGHYHIGWDEFELQQKNWLRTYAEANALAVAMVFFTTSRRMYYARLEPEHFNSDRLILDNFNGLCASKVLPPGAYTGMPDLSFLLNP